MTAIYIHFPYCKKKCLYCDFNVYVEKIIPEDQYLDAILKEIEFRSNEEENKKNIISIFFGGGTPSLLSAKSISIIIEEVRNKFLTDQNLEITIEANPKNLQTKLKSLLDAGINRLSIGAQTFNDRLLKKLGRDHNPEDIQKSVIRACKEGFTNISIDLIYGIPDQKLEDLEEDLLQVSHLPLDHLSAYSLTIEKGTSFYNDFNRGILKIPNEEIVLAMMDRIAVFAVENNFHRYEISNYARAGKESLHNKAYWNDYDYIGIGAGAHSYKKYLTQTENQWSKRWANLATPIEYMKSIAEKSSAESWSEVITKEGAMFEFFFTGLRKIKGVSVEEFKQRFKKDINDLYQDKLSRLTELELISFTDSHISLTDKGIHIADSVVQEFIL